MPENKQFNKTLVGTAFQKQRKIMAQFARINEPYHFEMVVSKSEGCKMSKSTSIEV